MLQHVHKYNTNNARNNVEVHYLHMVIVMDIFLFKFVFVCVMFPR
jgi:hypothetical protein